MFDNRPGAAYGEAEERAMTKSDERRQRNNVGRFGGKIFVRIVSK